MEEIFSVSGWSQESMQSLAYRLSLPLNENMQDWAWEVADAGRIDDFMSLLQVTELSEGERFTLLDILLQSFEELPIDPCEDPRWQALLRVTAAHFQLHSAQIRYWAALDLSIEDAFRVSGPLRKLFRECTGDASIQPLP